jgi:hypothetical protein
MERHCGKHRLVMIYTLHTTCTKQCNLKSAPVQVASQQWANKFGWPTGSAAEASVTEAPGITMSVPA